jgi:hypothetical protein
MRLPRFSIAALYFTTAIIAIDLTLLRWAIIERESVVTGRGLLFMINALGFGLYQLAKVRGKGCPFMIGFVATGLLVALIYFDYCQLFYNAAIRTQQWMLRPISAIAEVNHLDFMYFPWSGTGRLTTSRRLFCSLVMTPVVTGIIALPQLLLALAGGFLARRLTSASCVTTRTH